MKCYKVTMQILGQAAAARGTSPPPGMLHREQGTILGAGRESDTPELLEQFNESPSPEFHSSPPTCHDLAARQRRE